MKLGYKPSEFVNLPYNDKVFLIACIDTKIDAERKEMAKIK